MKHRQWPTDRSELVPGDGRHWQAFDMWLRSHGSSLTERVELLRGTPSFVRVWSIEVIRAAASAYIAKHRQRPQRNSTDTAGLPPRGTWAAALIWAHTEGYRRDDICGPRFFDLEQFRAYITAKGIDAWPEYRKLHRTGKLDYHCSPQPFYTYKIGWKEIVGREPFTERELRRYVSETEVSGHDIQTSSGYGAAYKAGLLDRRCPHTPTQQYPRWTWPRRAASWRWSGQAPSTVNGREPLSLAAIEQKLLEVGLALFDHPKWRFTKIPGDGRLWGAAETVAAKKRTSVHKIAVRLLGRPSVPRRTGESHHATILTWAKVDRLRELHRRGWSGARLAKKFGISAQTVHRIVTNKNWRAEDRPVESSQRAP